MKRAVAIENALRQMKLCIDDPMWANHAEVPKMWIDKWWTLLRDESTKPVSRETYEVICSLVAGLRESDTAIGYCCCGDSIQSHGIDSGHSPVDMGDYHANMAIERADELLRGPSIDPFVHRSQKTYPPIKIQLIVLWRSILAKFK